MTNPQLTPDVEVASPDLAQLARATGAAGRSWAHFQCEDAVQDFVDTHGASDAQVDAWRAAFDAGVVDHLAAQGWVSRWTTAPADYDSFGATTAESCGDWRGEPLRRILCHPRHAAYQASRNGSGNYSTWDADPRVEERESAQRRERWRVEDAARAARHSDGLAWLAAATESEIERALNRDEVESRGLTYVELRDEVRRREDQRAEVERAREWESCRATFQDGAILVDDGTPGFRGVYGWVAGRPTHVYYGCRVAGDGRRVADEATVEGVGGDRAGSLADIAAWLAQGRMRVVSPDDVPPEPVVRRIGHECYRDVVRAEVSGQLAWVGRPHLTGEPLVLDAAGRIVRSRAVREAALVAYRQAGHW